jgi:LAO/AO transport system kinase
MKKKRKKGVVLGGVKKNDYVCNTMEHPENDSKYSGLAVNSGVAQPPSVNPYLNMRPKRKPLPSASELVEGILKGDVTTLSRAVTLVESLSPAHQAIAQEVIEQCLPYSGNSRRIGITGVPGAGKSTSIDVFGLHVLRDGGKLAVLAIDPSSERTKGSILGDKTRMEKLAVHPAAFIRPSPSAGSLGGVARKTRETIVLCEAAGYNNIFVETVGVGQSETAVHSMVDFFLLIQLAGTGDELQGIKRGIMEMADGIVINKADGDNVDRARLAQAQFRSALHLFPPTTSGWMPEVLTYSGYYELGIKEVWEMIDRYFDYVKGNGFFEARRTRQARYWMYETINEKLRDKFYNDPEVEAMLKVNEQRVLDNRLSSFIAARDVLDFYFKKVEK